MLCFYRAGDPITRVLRSLIAGRGTQIIQNPVTGEPWIHSCLLGELVVESKPSSDPQSVTISISVTNKHHPDSEFIPSDGTVVLAQVRKILPRFVNLWLTIGCQVTWMVGSWINISLLFVFIGRPCYKRGSNLHRSSCECGW